MQALTSCIKDPTTGPKGDRPSTSRLLNLPCLQVKQMFDECAGPGEVNQDGNWHENDRKRLREGAVFTKHRRRNAKEHQRMPEAFMARAPDRHKHAAGT